MRVRPRRWAKAARQVSLVASGCRRSFIRRPPGRVGEQSKRGSRGQHAGATPAAELHGLYQHAYAPADSGAAEVGRQAHPTRPESPDAADLDLGSCEAVRPFRTRYMNARLPLE